MAARRAKFGNRAASMRPSGPRSDSVGNSSKISITTGGRFTRAALAGVSVALAWSSESEAHDATTSTATNTAGITRRRADRRSTAGQIRGSAAGKRLVERGRRLEAPLAHARLDLIAHGLQ